jgi:hypothetical protein
LWLFCELHLEQKCLDYIFPHSRRSPENAFGMEVEAEMARLDTAANAGFFPGFAFGSPAMRERSFGITLGKSPLAAAVRVHQQELDRWAAPPVADSRYLQWKSVSWNPGRAQFLRPP